MAKLAKFMAFAAKKIKCLSNIDLTDTSKWIWLMKLLRIIGQLPVTISNVENIKKSHINRGQLTHEAVSVQDKKLFQRKDDQLKPPKILMRFNCKCISLIAVYTFCVGIFRLPLFWSIRAKVQNCKSSLENNSIMITFSVPEQIICPMAFYSIPVLTTLEWFSVIFTVGYFCRFLNNWDQFNQLAIFKKGNNSAKLQMHGSSVRVRNSILWWLTSFFTIFASLSSVTCIHQNFHVANGGKKYVLLVRCLLAQMTAVLEDAKLWLMFLAVANGFQRVI